MEPFGLFHFLKTFLDSAPQTERPQTDETGTETLQERIDSSTEEPVQAEENSRSVNAVLQFMDAHERRAKPHRKP